MFDAELLAAFDSLRARRRPLVIACVVDTQGSTYRKPGAAMLLAPDPDGEDDRFDGLVSGGCLEGDLLEHARAAVSAGHALEVTYDLRDPEADALWGLGLGCAGLIRLLLVPAFPEDEHAPLDMLAACYRERRPARVQWVVGEGGRPGRGAMRVLAGGTEYRWPPDDRWPAGVDASVDADAGARLIAHDGTQILSVPLRPAPRLLVLGGGPDALPVWRFARVMGWDCPVLDHRPAYLAKLHAAGVSDARLCVATEPPPAELLADCDGALVMSHHLDTDAARLAQLAVSRVPWVGLLGPRARRERLLADLPADAAASLAPRLSAPVGLDLGGEGAASIALAAVAQFQAVLAGRPGGHLAGSPGSSCPHTVEFDR